MCVCVNCFHENDVCFLKLISTCSYNVCVNCFHENDVCFLKLISTCSYNTV